MSDVAGYPRGARKADTRRDRTQRAGTPTTGVPAAPRLRRRLTLAFAGGIALTALALSIVAYLLVAVALQRDARDEALAQSRFNLLLAQTILPAEPTPDDYARLLDALAIRGNFETLIVDGAATYPSGPQITPQLVTSELAAAVTSDRLTYQETTLGAMPALAVGTRVSQGGPAAYFFYPQDDRQAILQRLGRVLVGTGLALALLGVVFGWILARRLTRPVTLAGEAAVRVAAGDLMVRLPTGGDEFGTLGASFNTMTATLQAKIAALQAAEARERRFTADVAHELRTPVAALVGEASLLDRSLGPDTQTGLPQETRRAAELMVRDVGRLRRLIDDLLEISRFDAHSADVQWEQIELFDFLRRMASARGWTDAEMQLVRQDEHPVLLTTDRRRFERIVVNLVENGLLHGRPPVVVEVRLVAPRERPPQLVLAVTDHGPGISLEHLPHVFDRFYKADPSRGAPGTGLGLSIAWENARLLGGGLRVRTYAGEGTRFVLRLPLEPGVPSEEGISAEPTVRTGTGGS